jgi:hypothetical protein
VNLEKAFVFTSASHRLRIVFASLFGIHFAFDSIADQATLFFLDDWGRQTAGGFYGPCIHENEIINVGDC